MRRDGFTLIELVITLSIVVVLSGLLILRVAGWTTRQQLHASARAVGNAVRTWRERALTEERSYRLLFERDGWTVRDAADEVAGRGRLPVGAIEAPVVLALDRRGMVAARRIVIRASSGESMAVVLSPVLNEVEYQDAR